MPTSTSPITSHRDLPDLPDIDDNDDPDNVDSSSPLGSVASEGDPWADHPGYEDNEDDLSSSTQSPLPSFQPTPPPSQSLQSSPTGSAPKKVTWDDKIIDKPWSREGGRLRRDRKPNSRYPKEEFQLNLYPNRQIPTTAIHISRKRLKYRQRMAARRELGDQMLLSMENDSDP